MMVINPQRYKNGDSFINFKIEFYQINCLKSLQYLVTFYKGGIYMLGTLIATVVFALIIIGLIMNFKKIVRWIKNI